MSKPHFALAVAVLLLAGLLAWPRLPSTRAEDTDTAAPPQDVLKLQGEQIDTLREATKMADELLAQGVGSVSDANRLNHMLVDAQLSSAATGKTRTRILQEAIAAAKKEEQIADQQAKAGLGTALAPLEAKSYRLGLEIKLSQASGD